MAAPNAPDDLPFDRRFTASAFAASQEASRPSPATIEPPAKRRKTGAAATPSPAVPAPTTTAAPPNRQTRSATTRTQSLPTATPTPANGVLQAVQPSPSPIVPAQANALSAPTASEPATSTKSVKNMTDEEIWGWKDADIVAAHHATQRAPIFDHYLPVELTRDPENRSMTLTFRCKHKNPSHKPVVFQRSKIKNGTGRLNSTAATCGMDAEKEPAPETPGYTEARHRAICAVRCAHNKRPFQSQDDQLYRAEVELLRPGTIVPNAKIVANDVGVIYEGYARVIRWVFETRSRAIHGIIDGWTAPIEEAFLGLGLQWEQDAELSYMTLEFILLDESHTGKYLASELFQCLQKYGIDDMLFSLMMDNAANCNTTATELQKLNPKFDGKKRRGRCALHSIQLGAKIFLSFFSKEPARKPRKVKVATASGEVEEVTLEGITGDDGDAELNRLLDENAAADEADLQQAADAAAREIHDVAAIKTLRQRAIYEMGLKGVTVSAADTKSAIQLLPRVAGLSRRIHDSSPTKHAFATYVNADATIQGQTTTIARRCASRWDSDHDMLATALILEQPARKLLADKAFNLKAYRLTDKQWSLGREVRDLLECFQSVTQRFSRRDSGRALVCDVIPAMEELRRRMQNASEMDGTQVDADGELVEGLPDICRVAAYAASLVLDKYLLLMRECEIYEFAIALRPDLKLTYFRENGRSETDIKRIHDGLVERFKDFKSDSAATASASAPSSSQPVPRRSGGSRFDTKPRSTTPSVPTQIPDDIRSYLASPIVDLGGRSVLQYWHGERGAQPHLAEMALAFCSAPATSVDMERAFSEGRNMCAWNQRSMSSQTFREQISVGAWYDAPFFDMDIVEQIISEKSRPLRGPQDV